MKHITRLIAHLLFHANRRQHMVGKDRFYKIKDRLLQKWGEPDGYDLQHFEGKKCRSCGGTGVHKKYGRNGKVYDLDSCYHCCGGWYKSPKWVALERRKVAVRVFHKPVKDFPRLGEAVAFIGGMPAQIVEGFIEHEPGRKFPAVVFWLLFDARFYLRREFSMLGCAYRCSWSTPYNILNNTIGCFRRKWIREHTLRHFGLRKKPEPTGYPRHPQNVAWGEAETEMPF